MTRLASDAAMLLAAAICEERTAETDLRAAQWQAHADAHFATLVAAYRPTDPAPLRALLEQLAPMCGCKVEDDE